MSYTEHFYIAKKMSDDNGQCFSNDSAAERSDGRTVIATVSQTPIDDVLHCEICDVACRGNLGLSWHQGTKGHQRKAVIAQRKAEKALRASSSPAPITAVASSSPPPTPQSNRLHDRESINRPAPVPGVIRLITIHQKTRLVFKLSIVCIMSMDMSILI